MAIESSPYIAGLDTSIPANKSPRAEGAAQIRAIKTSLINTFPNLDGIVTATTSRMNEVFEADSQVPIGAIIMWADSTLPDGWAACDGEIYNGFETIDMRGFFPRGTVGSTDVGVTGGADEVDLSEHVTVDEHILSIDESPDHTHGYTDRYYAESEDGLESKGALNVMANDGGNSVGSGDTDSDNDGLLYVDATTESTGGGNGHSHGLSENESNKFDNRPAFIGIQFICYVGS